MRKSPLILGVLALAGLFLVIRVIDGGRASASLKGAYTVRDAGERCFSALAASFSASGIDGVSSTAASDPDFALWAQMSRLAAASTKTPIFFGKDRVLAMAIAAKQYDELLRTPRGTWMTLTHEIADKRSRLDAAIIAVETEDLSAATITNRRAESQTEIARTAKGIFDAKEKVAEDERLAYEKKEQEERERVRKLETAQTLREAEAQKGRERMVAEKQQERERMRALGAAGTPYTAPAPTPLAIDFSRPKPTPILGRK
jgi:hypothetical protein